MEIIKIELVKNVNVKNILDDYVYPLQNIIKVYFKNGESRTIDLVCNKDITNVNKLVVVYNDFTKIKVLFEEEL